MSDDITADDLRQFVNLSVWAEGLVVCADGFFGRSSHGEHFFTPTKWTDGSLRESTADHLADIVRGVMGHAIAFYEEFFAGEYEDRILTEARSLDDGVWLTWPIYLDCPGQPTSVPFTYPGYTAHGAVAHWAYNLEHELHKSGVVAGDDVSKRPASDPVWRILVLQLYFPSRAASGFVMAGFGEGLVAATPERAGQRSFCRVECANDEAHEQSAYLRHRQRDQCCAPFFPTECFRLRSAFARITASIA